MLCIFLLFLATIANLKTANEKKYLAKYMGNAPPQSWIVDVVFFRVVLPTDVLLDLGWSEMKTTR